MPSKIISGSLATAIALLFRGNKYLYIETVTDC
jgi:hypothetical protein